MGANPEGGVILHGAANEGLAGRCEFSCAKEEVCMSEDAQTAAGFGGQLSNVASPRRIMTVGETQEFDWSELPQEDCSKSGCEGLPFSPFGGRYIVIFVRIERHFPSI